MKRKPMITNQPTAAGLLGLALQCFGVYMILLVVFTRLNPARFIKKFFPVMAFAFSTSTSNATIPMNIDTLEERIGVSRKISSFTIPLGATINMDGTSIMQGVAVVFAAQAYGMQLDAQGYLTVIATATLASIGTAGIPSVGLVTLSMVFTAVGTQGTAGFCAQGWLCLCQGRRIGIRRGCQLPRLPHV